MTDFNEYFTEAFVIGAKLCGFVTAGVLYQAPMLSKPPVHGDAAFYVNAPPGCYCEMAKAFPNPRIFVVAKDLSEITVFMASDGALTFELGHSPLDPRRFEYPMTVFIGDQSEECKPKDKIS